MNKPTSPTTITLYAVGGLFGLYFGSYAILVAVNYFYGPGIAYSMPDSVAIVLSEVYGPLDDFGQRMGWFD